MTLTVELPDNKEALLKAKAQAHGVSAEQYAAQVLNRDLEETASADFGKPPIWEVITDRMNDVPE